jgi:predicted lipid-binding transport protein (Tim44 family)
MAALTLPIARAACDGVALPGGWRITKLGKSLGLARSEGESPEERAVAEMSARLDTDLRASTDQLIAIHGLEGRAASEVRARLASDVRTDAPLDESMAAVMGGVVTGALSGLAADLAAGGLTLGAGMLAGAVLGALGGAGVARGVNVARGRTEAAVRWDDAFLDQLVVSALLRYLAVAHYGRGRGDYVASESPPHWDGAVRAAIARHRQAWGAAWEAAAQGEPVERVRDRVRPLCASLVRGVLEALYPAAAIAAAPGR